MQLPGTPSLVLLAYILLFLPWAAQRSARRLHAAREGAEIGLSREKIWINTLVSQALLLALAWFAGSSFGYRPFAVEALGRSEILAALGALAALFVLRQIARATRSDRERRSLIVFFLAPRTAGQHALWVAVVLAASVAEEVAYRGVGMQVLWYALGNPWLAALIAATAFALAHWAQGWKTGVVIFAIALVMHGLVALTRTLVLAIAVHAIYDLVAGELIRRQALRFDAEAAAAH